MYSKSDLVRKLRDEMCPILGVDPENIRVWDYHGGNKTQLINNLDQSLHDARIINAQQILLEEKDENGNWPQTASRGGYSTGMSMGMGMGSGWSSMSSNQPSEPGKVGLVNLGNTCFMNSSLQSLSNTVPLTSYFLSDQYKQDINKDNPLGTGGKLCEQYAQLLKEIWSGRSRYIAPRDFKWKLERFAPQFAGYQQHDSQELLGYLLDGLHEDLNRIKKKPYVEITDSNPQTFEEEIKCAEEAWEKHKSRNDSVIVDWFQGQLKSKLVCPVCGKISITFDPMMYLSLPLPMKQTKRVKVNIVYPDQSAAPLRMFVTVPKLGNISDITREVAKYTNFKQEHLIVIESFQNRFHKYWPGKEIIENILDNDILFVFVFLLYLSIYPFISFYLIINVHKYIGRGGEIFI